MKLKTIYQKHRKQTQYLILLGLGAGIVLLAALAVWLYDTTCRWQQLCLDLSREQRTLQQLPACTAVTVPQPDLLDVLQDGAQRTGVQLTAVRTEPGTAVCTAEGTADYHGFIYFLTGLSGAAPLTGIEIRQLARENNTLHYTLVLRPCQDGEPAH